MHWIYWAIFAAAILHVIEEYSTGFLPWFRRAIPSLAAAMTPSWAFSINLLFLLLALGTALGSHLPPLARLPLAGIVLINAVLHVGMTIARRDYSPGLITAVLLYIPLGLLAYRYEFTSGKLSLTPAMLSILVALVLHSTVHLSLRLRPGR